MPLNKASSELILDLINEANQTDLGFQNIDFANPQVLTEDPDNKNTGLQVNAIQYGGYTGNVVVKYNRIGLGSLEDIEPAVAFIPVDGDIHDVVEALNNQYQLGLVAGTDINEAVDLSEIGYEPGYIDIAALSDSLAYTGELAVSVAWQSLELADVIENHNLNGLVMIENTHTLTWSFVQDVEYPTTTLSANTIADVKDLDTADNNVSEIFQLMQTSDQTINYRTLTSYNFMTGTFTNLKTLEFTTPSRPQPNGSFLANGNFYYVVDANNAWRRLYKVENSETTPEEIINSIPTTIVTALGLTTFVPFKYDNQIYLFMGGRSNAAVAHSVVELFSFNPDTETITSISSMSLLNIAGYTNPVTQGWGAAQVHVIGSKAYFITATVHSLSEGPAAYTAVVYDFDTNTLSKLRFFTGELSHVFIGSILNNGVIYGITKAPSWDDHTFNIAPIDLDVYAGSNADGLYALDTEPLDLSLNTSSTTSFFRKYGSRYYFLGATSNSTFLYRIT